MWEPGIRGTQELGNQGNGETKTKTEPIWAMLSLLFIFISFDFEQVKTLIQQLLFHGQEYLARPSLDMSDFVMKFPIYLRLRLG